MKKLLLTLVVLLMAVTAQATLPFITTPSPTTYPIHWYQLKINGMYLYANSGQWTDVDASSTASTADAYLWCFVTTSSGNTVVFNKAKRKYMRFGYSLTDNISANNINYVQEGTGNTFYICYNAQSTTFYLDYDVDNGLHSPSWKMHSFTAIEALVQENPPTPNGQLSLNLETFDDYCMLNAIYSGTEECTITLNVNGRAVNNPYRITRNYVDQELNVVATVTFNDMDPIVKQSTIVVPALPTQEFTGDIYFDFTKNEDNCVIDAYYIGSESYMLKLFVNGVLVDNPYTIARTGADQNIHVKARIEGYGMVPLEAESDFTIPKYEEPDLDLTFFISSMSSSAHNAEGASDFAKLYDKNPYTKWRLSMANWETFFIDLRSNQPFVPVGYVLTTGDDTNAHPNRNPKAWKLYGKVGTDSWDEEWELLATVTDGAAAGLGTSNMAEYEFPINGVNKEYRFIRFEVNELCGVEDGKYVFQLAELRVRGHAYKAQAGDVNGDGSCTSSDVTALYNYILYNDNSAIVNGDQNGDGSITSSDVTAVYNIILGL